MCVVEWVESLSYLGLQQLFVDIQQDKHVLFLFGTMPLKISWMILSLIHVPPKQNELQLLENKKNSLKKKEKIKIPQEG